MSTSDTGGHDEISAAPCFVHSLLSLGELELDADESQHALRVRRLRPGAGILLIDGHGHWARGVLLETGAASKRRPAGPRPAARVRVEYVSAQPSLRPALTLILPGAKGDRVEWLVEKATELGVARLVFVEFERSVVAVGPRRVEKLLRRAVEACKQCRRAWFPALETAGSLDQAVAEARPRGPVLLADVCAEQLWLHEWVARGPLPPALAIVIGPEGGFPPHESARLRSAGLTEVRLARHILRIETAAVSAAAIICPR